MSSNGEFSFTRDGEATSPGAGLGAGGRPRPAVGVGVTGKSLPRIQTHTKVEDDGICHDDSTTPVKAQTIDELHSLQKKKSAPTTPIKGAQAGAFAPTLSDEERHKQQLQSISASLASLTRATGPKLVKGDPVRKAAETRRVASPPHHYATPTLSISDSALKFTHVLYNLSPADSDEADAATVRGFRAVRAGTQV